MQLVRQGPPPMLEPFEDHDLPQRTRAVKTMGIEVSDPVTQLGIPTGAGQRGTTHVVGDIEAVIADPLRP